MYCVRWPTWFIFIENSTAAATWIHVSNARTDCVLLDDDDDDDEWFEK